MTRQPVREESAHVEDEIQQQTYWAMVPEWVIFHTELNAEAKVLYMALARVANSDRMLWRSQHTIADRLDWSERSVRRYMAVLVEHGALVCRKRRRNSSAIWWLPFDAPVFSVEKGDKEDRSDVAAPGNENQDRPHLAGRDRSDVAGQTLRTGQMWPPNESHISKANELEPKALLANSESERIHPGMRRQAVTWAIAESKCRIDKLTPSTAIAIKQLRKSIDEWLQAGFAKQAIVDAIVSSPYKTQRAVDGELRKQDKNRGDYVHSVGNDTLATAAEWLGGSE